jgi:hypothetical protein
MLNIVTDLINALPGNSSVNTVQRATMEEPIFFYAVMSPTIQKVFSVGSVQSAYKEVNSEAS